MQVAKICSLASAESGPAGWNCNLGVPKLIPGNPNAVRQTPRTRRRPAGVRNLERELKFYAGCGRHLELGTPWLLGVFAAPAN